jgi:hypothetical protein
MRSDKGLLENDNRNSKDKKAETILPNLEHHFGMTKNRIPVCIGLHAGFF